MPDLTPFTDHLRRIDRSEKMIQGYQNDLLCFSRWFEQSNAEQLAPANITPIDIREYRQYLVAVQGRSAATFNRHLATIRAYIDWGVSTGVITYNPIQGIKGIKVTSQSKARWLDRKDQLALVRKTEEAVQIAKTIPAERQAARDQGIVLLMLNTGLRLEELTELKMEDVELTERKGTLLVRSGKGLRSRTIPLNQDARRALRTWYSHRQITNHREVFLSSQDHPMSRRAIQHLFEGYASMLHLDISAHTMRHTFAKNLIDSGIGIEKVAMLLGHSSIETTRIYTTPSSQDLVKAVEGLLG